VAVSVPLNSYPFGDERYRPIWEAALEHGLPIVAHPGAGEGVYIGNTAEYTYMPVDYAEKLSDTWAIAAANLTSVVFRGVFDRYTELRLIFAEWGFSWAVSHMWRMDKAWRATRAQNPWVRRWPREYVHDNVRFTTQPIPEPPDRSELDRMVETYFADNLLFASDYPHWDGDNPKTILRSLPEKTRRKVFADNAMETFRWA
jgi:predicted TIM-barrel fold metal-dependent hydrolase